METTQVYFKAGYEFTGYCTTAAEESLCNIANDVKEVFFSLIFQKLENVPTINSKVGLTSNV